MKKLRLLGLLLLSGTGLSARETKDFVFPGEPTEGVCTQDIFAGAIASATVYNIKELYYSWIDEERGIVLEGNLKAALNIIATHTRADLWNRTGTSKIVKKPNSKIFFILACDRPLEDIQSLLSKVFDSEEEALYASLDLAKNIESSLHIIKMISETPSGKLYKKEYSRVIEKLEIELYYIKYNLSFLFY